MRGVCPAYGEMRNQVPAEGRWISREDQSERHRVAFLGNKLRANLFSGRPAVDETVTIAGLRFTVIGVLESKMQDSSYFSPDNQSAFIPYSTAGFLWDTRYAGVLVFTPLAPQFEARALGAKRRHIRMQFLAEALTLPLLVSTSVLILTGVLSGLFPAIRASRLDPAETLRYE